MEITLSIFLGIVACLSMFLAFIARNPIKKLSLIGFGLISGIFSIGPVFIKEVMNNYPMTILVVGLVIGYYLITSLWRAMNHLPVSSFKHMTGVVMCIIVLVVGGRQFTMSFFNNVVSDKVDQVSTSTSNYSETATKTFHKIIRPFWKVSESGFSIYVDRSLLNNFGDSDMAIIEARLRDLARAMGSDSDDMEFENLYIGGQITIAEGDITLISLSNAGRENIELGLIIPSRGGNIESKPGIGILKPSDVSLKIKDDTVQIVSSLIDYDIDHNGEIHCGIYPKWN